VEGGSTGRVGLARTVSGSIRQLARVAVEELGPDPQWLMVFHADAPDEAAELAERLCEAVHVVRCENLPLSPLFGAHTGPGTIGFAALPWPGGVPPD
jgi:fatty acid-binding protein DegV